MIQAGLGRGFESRHGAFGVRFHHRAFERDLDERDVLLEWLDALGTLAIDVEHDGQRRLRALERGCQEFGVAERVASTDADGMEDRALGSTDHFLRDRLRRVHRRRLCLGGEANEKLTSADPNALRLESSRNAREGSGWSCGSGHYFGSRLSAVGSRLAMSAMRSQRSGNETPAAAAAWGTRLVCVIPGRVLASRQKRLPSSVMRKSMRAQPRNLRLWNARFAKSCASRAFSVEMCAGNTSSAIPGVYLHS